jgi:hypothetical protein
LKPADTSKNLIGKNWIFLKDGLDDFRDGLPPPVEGDILIKVSVSWTSHYLWKLMCNIDDLCKLWSYWWVGFTSNMHCLLWPTTFHIYIYTCVYHIWSWTSVMTVMNLYASQYWDCSLCIRAQKVIQTTNLVLYSAAQLNFWLCWSALLYCLISTVEVLYDCGVCIEQWADNPWSQKCSKLSQNNCYKIVCIFWLFIMFLYTF